MIVETSAERIQTNQAVAITVGDEEKIENVNEYDQDLYSSYNSSLQDSGRINYTDEEFKKFAREPFGKHFVFGKQLPGEKVDKTRDKNFLRTSSKPIKHYKLKGYVKTSKRLPAVQAEKRINQVS